MPDKLQRGRSSSPSFPRKRESMLDKLQQGWRQAGWLNYLLFPLSLVYGLLMLARRYCYQLGVFKRISLAVPVIVVGGVTVGGSGKTPVALSLVRHFQDRGFRPGVICKGYRGHSPFWPREVNDSTTAALVGDEAQLIYELTGVPVVAGPERARNGVCLIDKFGCNILFSDDGFQHHALGRDLDIVALDGQVGYGNGWCLPAGPLREFRSQIKRADIVLVNGADEEFRVAGLQAYRMSMRLSEAYNLSSGIRKPLSEFTDRPVHGVAGVGNPIRFFRQLERLGLDVIRHPFPDHHPFTESDLDFGGDGWVLMTEKDAIKCRDMTIKSKLWAIPAVPEIDSRVFDRIDQLIPPVTGLSG